MNRSVFNNLLANIGGRAFGALLAIGVLPVYLSYLGAEAYGLVAMLAVLDMLFNVCDLGLSKTINRELARLRGDSTTLRANVVVTFERIYWAIGVVIGGFLILFAEDIGRFWFSAHPLLHTNVLSGLVALALVFTVRWPLALYAGALDGLGRQVSRNALTVVAAALRAGISISVLLYRPTVAAFLYAQFVGYCVELIVSRWLIGRDVHQGGAFSSTLLKQTWRYALSFNFVGALLLLGSQSDKMLISKLLPLEQLGYYSIATTAAGLLPMISLALGSALFPEFAAATRTGAVDLERKFRLLTQMSSGGAVLIAMPFVLHSHDILLMWTRSSVVANQGSAVLRILVIASVLWCTHLPAYQLLAAVGKTRTMLAIQAANVIVALPLMVYTIPRYGIDAAAAAWLVQNCISVVAYPMAAAAITAGVSSAARVIRDVSELLLYGTLIVLVSALPARYMISPWVAAVATGAAMALFAVVVLLRFATLRSVMLSGIDRLKERALA